MTQHQDETEKAVKQLQQDEFPFPRLRREHNEAELPAGFDGMGDIELGNHLAIWASLYSRARFELAKSEADEHVLESKIRWTKAKAQALIPANAKVTIEKAKIEAREDVLGFQKELDLAKVQVKLLYALAEGYKKKFDAISREISRREEEKKKWGSKRHNEGGR